MNKDSIFFKLNILFIVALLTTAIAGVFVIGFSKKRARQEEFFKARVLLREYRKTASISPESLKLFNIKLIKGKQKANIIKNGRKIILPKRRARVKIIHIIFNKKHYYLVGKGDNSYLLTFNKKSNILILITIFIALELFLIILYLLIRKNLKPLKELNKDINAYAKGYRLEPKYINSKDEVAKINNAFYNYATKADALMRSRELFIRNIFHELNTPVTKGKLLAELSTGKQKEMLESIFNRLSNLLKELSNIERVTSKEYKLNTQTIPIIELIDSAKELLYIEKIEHNIKSQTIKGDFNALQIVFKNLIDNGIKYGKNFNIEYTANKICFKSKAQKLTHPLNHYTQPFTSGNTNNKSMGLGLYIVNEILKMHKMNLSYTYENGENCFCIE